MKISKLFVFILICCVCSLACSAKIFQKHKKNVKKESIFYPGAPDTAHIQYLTSISNSAFLGKRSKFSTFISGPQQIYNLSKPYGLSFRNGKLYICDPGLAGLEIIDFDKNKFTNFAPGGQGQFKSPLNCYVDKNDYLYVADPMRQDVIVFDSTDSYIAKIKDTGIFKPTDVVVENDKIWITNPDNHCINVYDKYTRKFISHFAQQYGVGDDGFLYSPFNVFVSDQKVYVTDFGDFKIKIYDLDGNYLSSIGSYGTSIGQFVRPKGIACDRDSNLFVVDAGFENVQIFNKNAQLLMFFGGAYKGPGDMWLPAKVIVDYDNISYFSKYVDPGYNIKYLVVVSNQFGPDKINIYAAVSPK